MQAPAAGTIVLDTGAPTVALTLAQNRSYAENGTPENDAPYPGTAIRIPATPLAALKLVPKLPRRFVPLRRPP